MVMPSIHCTFSHCVHCKLVLHCYFLHISSSPLFYMTGRRVKEWNGGEERGDRADRYTAQ